MNHVNKTWIKKVHKKERKNIICLIRRGEIVQRILKKHFSLSRFWMWLQFV